MSLDWFYFHMICCWGWQVLVLGFGYFFFGLYPHSFGINAIYFLINIISSVDFITKMFHASGECVAWCFVFKATIPNSIKYLIQPKLEMCVGYKWNQHQAPGKATLLGISFYVLSVCVCSFRKMIMEDDVWEGIFQLIKVLLVCVFHSSCQFTTQEQFSWFVCGAVGAQKREWWGLWDLASGVHQVSSGEGGQGNFVSFVFSLGSQWIPVLLIPNIAVWYGEQEDKLPRLKSWDLNRLSAEICTL